MNEGFSSVGEWMDKQTNKSTDERMNEEPTWVELD